MINYISLLVALSISGVAAYYSIVGLATIFAGAWYPVIVMGIVLEVGKVTTASWLHKYWNTANRAIRYYLTIIVLILMFITSMGIFGFLSKAHLEQVAPSAGNDISVEQLDMRIERERRRISDSEAVINQLDSAVQVLTDAKRIRGSSGSIAVRESQKEERESLQKIIDESFNKIQEFQDEKSLIQREQANIEAEVGPIKYISDLIYGSNSTNDQLESAVRIVIIILVMVFDPLAIVLLIASNTGLRKPKSKVGRPKGSKNKKSFTSMDKRGILKINNNDMR
jgi:hypothetical protein